MDDESAKRQKVVHLTPAQQCRQRPDMYIGSIALRDVVVPVFLPDGTAEMRTIVFRLGFVSLLNELVTNALDNAHRPGEMHRIDVKWDGERVVVSNDGFALSTRDEVDGTPAVQVAFGWMHSGTNFNQTDTGKKANKYTAGRNGVGGKACLVFSTRYQASVSNAAESRTLEVTWDGGFESAPATRNVACRRKTNETRVTWTPDASVLGDDDGRIPADAVQTVCAWLAHNAALCAPPSVTTVAYNGKSIKLRTPEQHARALGGITPLASTTVRDADGVEVLRLCVAARRTPLAEPEAGLTHAFVNSTPCPNGTHEALVHRVVCDALKEHARTRRNGAGADACLTPSFLRRHAILVVVVLVDNENFTDQTKRNLDTPVRDYGWTWKVDPDFKKTLGRLCLVDRAVELARQREEADAIRVTKATPARHPTSDSKYEPATRRGTAQSTIIVCEGDSAANLVRSGLSVVGRAHFGLYPLRGKFLNARGMRPRDILENREAMTLLRILGIQMGVEYDDAMVRKLPYRRLLIMSDQDVDGSHIAGLVINFVETVAPSLLARHPSYICRFATALIRVQLSRKREEITFFSQTEYEDWARARRDAGEPLGTARYFKGLGTSTAALAKEYFRDLDRNVIVMRHTGAPCADALDVAFHKTKSDARKALITACDPKAFVDYAASETTIETFVTRELIPQYALASVVRAIPALDGLKEALRKALFGMREMRLRGDGDSVANAAGEIASRTRYHHRAAALEDTLIGMAADYAGTSNVNLLLPLGQFGTRYKHAAASAAYVKVALNDPLQSLLFRPEDDPLLERVEDEGRTVEPRTYCPVIALPLVLGARGIATGWSTDVPQFHPVDVVDATLCVLDDAEVPPLVPWYRGFGGEIDAEPTEDGSVPVAFRVAGLCEWRGDDLHVTELPPFREVEAYKEDWLKAGHTDEIETGGTDETIHLVLRRCALPRDEDPRRALGMIKRVGYGNMHLLDASGRLSKYATPEDVLRDHAALRLPLYERRLRHEVEACERDLRVAEARADYIEHSERDTFRMRDHASAADAAEALRALGLPEHPSDGGYDYLLRMEGVSLVAEHRLRLRARAETLRVHLGDLRARTPRAVWRAECLELRALLAADPRYARGSTSAS